MRVSRQEIWNEMGRGLLLQPPLGRGSGDPEKLRLPPPPIQCLLIFIYFFNFNSLAIHEKILTLDQEKELVLSLTKEEEGGGYFVISKLSLMACLVKGGREKVIK